MNSDMLDTSDGLCIIRVPDVPIASQRTCTYTYTSVYPFECISISCFNENKLVITMFINRSSHYKQHPKINRQTYKTNYLTYKTNLRTIKLTNKHSIKSLKLQSDTQSYATNIHTYGNTYQSLFYTKQVFTLKQNITFSFLLLFHFFL